LNQGSSPVFVVDAIGVGVTNILNDLLEHDRAIMINGRCLFEQELGGKYWMANTG
jgi:hypothetical protein